MYKNILVFPCGTEIANEVINSLDNHKYFKLFFASSAASSFCNFRKKDINIDILPFVNSVNFYNELTKLIMKHDIDFIIPAHDDVAYELSGIDLPNSCQVIGQSRKVNEIVRFKDKTYEQFQDIIPTADIFIDPQIDDFPLFVKPIRGQGSLNAVSLSDINAYQAFFKKHERDEFIVMEELVGEEFTIDCFSHHGKVLYSGARNREKTTKGISVISRYVPNNQLQSEFLEYAKRISLHLDMHGVWFFQMKYDKNNNLKLLEIGPRVPGSMILNRARGVNFCELAIYQALGMDISVIYNDIQIALGRALTSKFKHDMQYESLYIDFDDTLFLHENKINSNVIRMIFDAKNEQKKVYLITKNTKNNLTKVLHNFGISNIFDDIIHLKPEQHKVDFMENKSLLIDDSFLERKEAINNGHFAYGIDGVDFI